MTVAILPLQAYSSPVSIGMCVVLLFLWGVRAASSGRATIVWTSLHWTLLAFLGIVGFQLVPLPFDVHSLRFSHSFHELPVSLERWPTVTFDERTTSQAAMVLAALIGYFFIAANLFDSERRLRTVVNGLMVIGSAISLLGVLDVFSPAGDPLLKGGGNRLGFYYFSFQRLSGYLELLFPLPLALLLTGAVGQGRWVWYGLAAVIVGIGMGLSGSTGAILVPIVQLMSLLFLTVKGRSEKREGGAWRFDRMWTSVGALVIMGTITSGVAWLSTHSVPEMVAQDVGAQIQEISQLGTDASTSDYYGRAAIWKGTLRMIADHPLLGVGFGVHPIVYPRYDPSSGFKFVNAAHNDYLQLVSETGLVGGSAMMLFLFFLFRFSQRSLRSETPLSRGVALGATVGCLGILVHSLIDFHLQSAGTALLFLILTALLVGVERGRAEI